jgi:hypothetical protein
LNCPSDEMDSLFIVASLNGKESKEMQGIRVIGGVY